jgi:hypothetical protein
MRKRSLAVVIILSLITFGIYSLYWLISTRNELVRRGAQIPRVIVLILPLLILVGLAALQFIVQFAFSMASSGTDVPTSTGPHIFEIFTIGVGVLCAIALIPVTFYWMYKYCQGAQLVTGGRVTTSFAYGLWAVLFIFNVSFIWPGIMQNAYNQTS